MIKKLITALICAASSFSLNGMENSVGSQFVPNNETQSFPILQNTLDTSTALSENREGSRGSILELDGGGIRGAFQIKVLSNLCSSLNIKPYKVFNLISGTSIGSIHALALGMDIDLDQIVNLYKKSAQTIFQSQFSLDGLDGPLYSAEGLEGYLKQMLGPDTPLNAAKTNLMIPFYDTLRGLNIPMCSWDSYTGLVKMWHAGRASTAAPTYFIPHEFYMRPDDFNENNRFSAIDGGMGLNNSTALSTIFFEEEFHKMRGMEGISRRKKPFVLSIGTGTIQPLYPSEVDPTPSFYPYPLKETYLPYSEVSRYGLIGWGRKIIDIFMGANSEGIEAMASRISGDYYHRVQVKLPSNHITIDNYSLENIEFLMKEADRLEDTTHYKKMVEDLKRYIDENHD